MNPVLIASRSQYQSTKDNTRDGSQRVVGPTFVLVLSCVALQAGVGCSLPIIPAFGVPRLVVFALLVGVGNMRCATWGLASDGVDRFERRRMATSDRFWRRSVRLCDGSVPCRQDAFTAQAVDQSREQRHTCRN